MTDRASRINNFILGPTVSIILGLIAFVLLLGGSWPALIYSIAICALMVYDIKARALYKGPNFAFIPIFLTFQCFSGVTAPGSLIALFVAGVLSVLYLMFQRQDQTKLIFLIYLVSGLGALWLRGFFMTGLVLMVAIILVRAFSARGFVAALLGFFTPLIILGGFGMLDVFTLILDYVRPFELGINRTWMISATIAFVFGLVMFLPSYGYPAMQRARNMMMLGVSACAIVLPCIDFLNFGQYIPILNLCAAYNVVHFAATRSYGWVCYLLTIAAIVVVSLI